jgi:hypothetical protein
MPRPMSPGGFQCLDLKLRRLGDLPAVTGQGYGIAQGSRSDASKPMVAGATQPDGAQKRTTHSPAWGDTGR